MSSETKLWYFSAPALAEPIRFLLSYAGIKFTDQRFSGMEEFQKHKSTFPYGKVPVLEYEGRMLHQTKAICRFLARKSGLAGKSEWDQQQCDTMVDTVDDLRTALSAYYYESNAAAKEAKKDNALNVATPYYLDKFEKHLGDNGGHFVKGQLTWADIYLTSMEPYLSFMAGSPLFDKRPNLQNLQAKVAGLKGIKEYVAQRPKFPA